jgi:hypothetical protein
MSVRIMAVVWNLESMEPSEKLVLLSLADNANDQGVCWPSVSNMVKKTALSERTVQRVLVELIRAGHLSRHDRPGRSTYFTVHPRHNDTPDTTSPPSPCHPTPVTVTPHPRHHDTQNHHITIIEPSIAPESAKPTREKEPKKVSQKRRTGFSEKELPELWRTYVEDRIPDADPDEMFCNFRDHHLKTGHPMADWGAAWRTWVQNVMKGIPYVRRVLPAQHIRQTKPQITAADWIRYQEERKARIEAGEQG